MTSPLPGSPGFEFTRAILSPIPASPDVVFVSFESPYLNLASGYLALAFIFPSTSGLYVPCSETGVLPIYRWSPGWQPDAEGTLLEVGAVTGLNQFSGSALIAKHSRRTAELRADLHARGNPGVSASSTLLLRAGEVRRLEVTLSGPLHLLGYRVNGTGDPVTLRAIER